LESNGNSRESANIKFGAGSEAEVDNAVVAKFESIILTLCSRSMLLIEIRSDGFSIDLIHVGLDDLYGEFLYSNFNIENKQRKIKDAASEAWFESLVSKIPLLVFVNFLVISRMPLIVSLVNHLCRESSGEIGEPLIFRVFNRLLASLIEFKKLDARDPCAIIFITGFKSIPIALKPKSLTIFVVVPAPFQGSSTIESLFNRMPLITLSTNSSEYPA
jgi:hypothetical protein